MNAKHDRPSNHPALKWRPMTEAWAQLVRENEELGIGESATAQWNFRARHGDALRAAGILSRGPDRSFRVDTTRFESAFFLLIAGRPLCELAGAVSSEPPR